MKKWLKNLKRKKVARLFFRGRLSFDKAYKRIVYSTRKTLFPFYNLHSESLDEVLKVKDELIAENGKEVDKDFSTAVLMLLTRSIQHLESIFLLTERGLYGDAFTLLRSVLSDMNMFYYLRFNPDLIPTFLKESDDSYQGNKDFQSSFNEGAIDRDLKTRGVKSVKPAFVVLSKTAHASAWGTQMYGKEGKSGKQQYHMKYGPGFEVKKALALLGVVVSAHADYLVMILDYRKDKGLDLDSDFWKGIIKRVKELHPKASSLSDFGESVLIKLNLESDAPQTPNSEERRNGR